MTEFLETLIKNIVSSSCESPAGLVEIDHGWLCIFISVLLKLQLYIDESDIEKIRASVCIMIYSFLTYPCQNSKKLNDNSQQHGIRLTFSDTNI